MTKSGVNTGFAKCFILFMAIVILVQGILYFGLAIWGITQENCSGDEMDVSGNPFRFVLDLIYFIREDCGGVSLTSIPSYNEPVNLSINWEQSVLVTNRMYVFLIVYAVISGLWVVGSLLVIATICGPVTKSISAFCFWPWFMFVIAGSILDAVATGYHIHDIVHTTTAENTFDYVGIQSPPAEVLTFLESFDAYFITPAVVLTCVSSRVVLIWLLNIFGTSFCLSLSRVLADERKHSHHKHKHPKPKPENAMAITAVPAQTLPTSYANQVQSQSPGGYTHQQNRPPSLFISASQPQMQRQASSNAPAQSPYSPNAPALTPDVVIVETARPQSAYRDNSSNVLADDITYRKTDSHPDRLDYPPKTPQSPVGTTSTIPTAQLSSGSALNTRYSSMENNYNPSQNQSPQRVSDELRSQLPWSYTSMATKPQLPRKPQSQVYPEIPEPDYNIQSTRGQQSGPTGVINDADQQHAYSRW